MRKSEGVGFPRTWASDLNGGDKRVTLGETRRFEKVCWLSAMPLHIYWVWWLINKLSQSVIAAGCGQMRVPTINPTELTDKAMGQRTFG